MLITEEQRQAILAPIGESVGIDGRADEGEVADLLRDLRSDRKMLVRLEQGAALGGGESAVPDGARSWEDLAEAAADYLGGHSKDLEPMAILIEAAARSDDPADLAEAMTVLAQLVETFWDQGLYPQEDEDGIETRFQPLSGLSGGSQDKEGALILPLRRIKLAESGGAVLRYLDKVRADAAMAASQTLAGEAKTARVQEATELYAAIESLSRQAPGATIERSWVAMSTAAQGWRQTIDFITERTKPRMPASSRLSQEFAGLCEWLEPMRPQEEAAADPDAADGEAPAGDGGAGAVAAGAGERFMVGTITRRDDALKAISAAAQYFQSNEPLSPLGAALREVDRRARMSLDELLSELIPSDSARNDFYWRSGIRPPSGSGNGDD